MTWILSVTVVIQDRRGGVCCMALLGIKARSSWVTAALALLLLMLVLHWWSFLLQYFLYHAVQILGYNNLKVYPLQSPPLVSLGTAVYSSPCLWASVDFFMGHSLFRGIPAAGWTSPPPEMLWDVLLLHGLIHRSSPFNSARNWSTSMSSTAAQNQQWCPGHQPAQAHSIAVIKMIPGTFG